MLPSRPETLESLNLQTIEAPIIKLVAQNPKSLTSQFFHTILAINLEDRLLPHPLPNDNQSHKRPESSTISAE